MPPRNATIPVTIVTRIVAFLFLRATVAAGFLSVLPRKMPAIAIAMQMALFLVCGGCHPMAGPVTPAAIAVAAPAVAVEPRTPPAQPASPASSPAQAPQVARAEIGGILLEGVAFDSRTARLIVADQPGGPGARWADAAAATAAHGGLAGINAGLSKRTRNPLDGMTGLR
jgi:hypothetical protein